MSGLRYHWNYLVAPMRKVRDISAVPKGGTFIYVHENGYEQRHPYFNQLKEFVKQYKLANNFPITLTFDDEFEQNVCAHAADITCEEFVPPSLLGRLSSVAKALYRSAKSGFKVVAAEQFEERKAICGACNYYRGDNGLLKIACARCGCSGVKLHVASEHCPIYKWNSL